MKQFCVRVVLLSLLCQFGYSLSFAAWPLKNSVGEDVGTITDIYSSGRDEDNDKAMDFFHGGVDIAASEGTGVYALAAGTVTVEMNPFNPEQNHILAVC